ncbi:hypothetical protein [Rhizobium leguminosarum]|uniref:hypothetical protein n=2 Tax=Rhizobium leguminosarum TaxID=384 RepID=UPI001C98849C|nr:hypothetical protein [Rhizobium leguminosarum]
MDVTMSPDLVKLALEHCGTSEFEKYSQTMLGALVGPSFKPLGGHKDGGADGFVDADIWEQVDKQTRFFQASKTLDVEKKIRDTIARLKDVGREPNLLYYSSSLVVPYIDKLEMMLSDELGATIKIYDRNWFAQRASFNNDVEAAFGQYLRPAVQFLEDIAAPSYPVEPVFQNAQAVCAFLSHELERRIGTTKTLEGVCDGLLIWALEETDPDAGKLLTEKQILEKIEYVIPTARKFLRGQIGARLKALTVKKEGSRTVNVHTKEGGYCLPFEARKQIRESLLDDENLKLQVTDAFRKRIIDAGVELDEKVLEQIPDLIHKTIEMLFEQQGYNAVRHFSDDPDQSALDARSVIEVAGEVVDATKLTHASRVKAKFLIKQVLRGALYNSEPIERAYFGRLARTYVLLFVLKNTPELIEHFSSMAKHFVLYVGTDILVRAISEYYLHEDDQMTVNTLKILKQAGAKLILSEPTLEEVHSHIYASDREYVNTYSEVDAIVDRDLASESDRILIRAYYYAKLEQDNPKRPRSWAGYLGNFLTYDKLMGPTSPQSMRSLRDTLIARYGVVYEAREDMMREIDQDDLKKLTEAIKKLRKDSKRRHEDIRAANDAVHILLVQRKRKAEEKEVTSPYGYRTWWLTQETKSGIAVAYAFPKRHLPKAIMRPELLINYIAYNPTTAEVRRSMGEIFPSLMGIRLGTRLEQDQFEKIMGKIKEAHSTDPARAQAMVAEHSNALIGQTLREFSIKYTSTI